VTSGSHSRATTQPKCKHSLREAGHLKVAKARGRATRRSATALFELLIGILADEYLDRRPFIERLAGMNTVDAHRAHGAESAPTNCPAIYAPALLHSLIAKHASGILNIGSWFSTPATRPPAMWVIEKGERSNLIAAELVSLVQC
jgi:hypothetical protein